ncbi:hypothetical protein AB1K83_13475 [Sporosarcina sp. 179-K 3D1 HS]|uniref:tetratricopeptide repeat protein n=1 Tax=Sporosarcina sp. 179-K 3D1 HS TaxID=3232169 RepID=UPI0039A31057
MNSTRVHNLASLIQQKIRQKKYTQALASLKALESAGGDRQLILWHQAVLESKIGNLHIALRYLDEIKDAELLPRTERLKRAIEVKWTAYEALIAEYNSAVLKIQQGNAEQALTILDDAMERAGDLAIPLDVYRAKTLLLARFREEALARFALELPVHALDEETIAGVLLAVQSSLETTAVPVVKKRRMNKHMVALYAAALTAISLSAFLLFDSKTSPEQANEEISKMESSAASPVIVESEAEMENSRTTPEQAAESVPEREEKPEMVPGSVADQPLFIPPHIAKNYYLSGYEKYRQGRFPEAVAYLEMAVRSEEPAYFTDDADYFLAVSRLEEEAYDQVLQVAERFAEPASIHHEESPYREAIRLQQGKALYALGQQSEAIVVLRELADHPSAGWVGQEAQMMLRLVMASE